ncbi:predicted protein [Sclerotinia sclerotiorum 1980 UF-70]|uniref:Uncharacterized protein n=1 Tax=Sclerotinia sclerotiorum (strain ATCC 18683 / 1980 / Ss-1) TaxID=665079 RepID=A7EMJ0_SCLS1|nr:predicted protein [Sclerotinia sclerotiorum 1980 UF-70]EDO04056.1 predicted protein [Sclerotinia sclerotiorum 1980 UF-70]
MGERGEKKQKHVQEKCVVNDVEKTTRQMKNVMKEVQQEMKKERTRERCVEIHRQ